MDNLERLRALEAKATPASAISHYRYVHGGGRHYVEGVERECDRKLVFDSYHEEDREWLIAARNALPLLLDVAEAAVVLHGTPMGPEPRPESEWEAAFTKMHDALSRLAALEVRDAD